MKSPASFFFDDLCVGLAKRCVLILVSGLVCVSTAANAQITADTKARKLVQDGRYQEALSTLNVELKRRPRDGQLLLLQGSALSLSGRKPEAMKIFSWMANEKIETAAAYNNMGVIHVNQGDYDSARGALEFAVIADPSYATAHQNLGNVYSNLASQAYRRALQLDRSDATLPTKVAQLAELLGHGQSSTDAAPKITKPTEPTEQRESPPPVERKNPEPTKQQMDLIYGGKR
jgi:tetratricopeptide (TPR) repeat protein